MLSLFSKRTEIAVARSTVFLIFGILLGLYFLFQVRSIVILVFLAFIMMVALNPVALKLQKYLKLPRILSIVFTYILLITILSLLVGLVLPPLLIQLYALLRAIDIPLLQDYVSRLNLSLSASDISSIADQVGSSIFTVMGVVLSTFAGIFTTFTLFVLSFFMLIERPVLHKKIAWFTSEKKYFDVAEKFLNKIEMQLGGWVRGQVVLMLVITLLSYVGFLLIGIPYALPLAILAGLLEILPNIGPTIAAVPAIAIAYITAGPALAVVALLFSILVQQLENNVIVPKVMRENANVNPLISIIAILIGLQLAGVIGALLAIPVYIVVRTVYSSFFRA